MVKRICVYAASSSKVDQKYINDAYQLGSILAKSGITTIYGGGSIGLMGALAHGVLENNGTLVGVIPKFMMELEWGNPHVDEMHVVETMAERKQKLIENIDAIVALPGGTGTLEELSEALSLKKLALFTKPIVLLNTNQFYDHLIEFLGKMIEEQFIRNEHQDLYSVAQTPEEVLFTIKNAPQWSTDHIRLASM